MSAKLKAVPRKKRSLRGELEFWRSEAEAESVRCAACLTAAEGTTSPKHTAKQGEWGWSPAYQRVLDLRRDFDTLQKFVRSLGVGSKLSPRLRKIVYPLEGILPKKRSKNPNR